MFNQTTPRAKNMEEYLALGPKFRTEEGYQAALAFQPRPDDIIISPYAKSGTTWLQQIAHGLRTRGSMDFEEICDVIPWIELAHDYGWDLSAEHAGEPRVFKSHMAWYDIPKGARYICSIRHPYDVAVSFYRFLAGWWFEPEGISLDAFVRLRFTENPERGGYWHHLLSWWEQRETQDILFLCFEDMKEDLPATVKLVADFMGIELDDELFDIVLRQSSKEFMLENVSQFDEHLVQEYFAKRGGVPPTSSIAKVTKGAKRYQLSDELKEEFDTIWQKMIYPRFGFEDYAALRSAIADYLLT